MNNGSEPYICGIVALICGAIVLCTLFLSIAWYNIESIKHGYTTSATTTYGQPR